MARHRARHHAYVREFLVCVLRPIPPAHRHYKTHNVAAQFEAAFCIAFATM